MEVLDGGLTPSGVSDVKDGELTPWQHLGFGIEGYQIKMKLNSGTI